MTLAEQHQRCSWFGSLHTTRWSGKAAGCAQIIETRQVAKRCRDGATEGVQVELAANDNASLRLVQMDCGACYPSAGTSCECGRIQKRRPTTPRAVLTGGTSGGGLRTAILDSSGYPAPQG